MATKRTSDYALRIYRRIIRYGSEVCNEMNRKRFCLDDKSLHCFVGAGKPAMLEKLTTLRFYTIYFHWVIQFMMLKFDLI
ncbi:hypothetical protein K2173_006509 [Erythroxylum novogranatense]|uniref:Uncharacterized protein n=1 Tax=Erythroxylum novogranatense TaxID=1862640 RepID=A0AAV8T552_9ROSI|nr:hypothetical protein K2173_006509 [Erythroxylum novogranatense]